MSFMDSFKKWTGIAGEEREEEQERDDYFGEMPRAVGGDYDDDYGSIPRPSYIKASKAMSIPATTHLQVIVVKPEKYSDAGAIADHFKNKKTVVLNLDNTNKDVANRLIDFLGGVAYASDGEIKRIANTTYIIVPVNVDISGDMIDELGSNTDFI